MVNEKILCAGFGGQGVMSMGQMLAYAGMLENYHVSWMPSYGPEMRGGTAYCCVVISDMPIGSPVIADDADCAVVMNLPSLQKFASAVKPGGHLLVNSSMVREKCGRTDVHTCYIPADDLAAECGSRRSANMVMLGAYLELSRRVSQENILTAFSKVFGKKGDMFLAENTEALKAGKEFAATAVSSLYEPISCSLPASQAL
ncbi:MAG: 2-oxoacid:acceptor oxidoreductase family protein [Desulfopila sp.]|jgi:2-oxoglutarate ferredoxin oxidoreductase subunit gamma|nr:2-oxoacid:acceptor oxidoreductase family protein [Desulfopila sp.]